MSEEKKVVQRLYHHWCRSVLSGDKSEAVETALVLRDWLNDGGPEPDWAPNERCTFIMYMKELEMSCRRCGKPKESWQIYCGAACSQEAERSR